jgi:hypothetical protein
MKSILQATTLAFVLGMSPVRESVVAAEAEVPSALPLVGERVLVEKSLWKADQVQFVPGSSSASYRKDPATGKMTRVFDLGSEGTSRWLSIDEIKSNAETGDVRCQMELSYFYETGTQGFSADSVQAYKWATLAEAGKVAGADHAISRLELFMKPTEIEQAKKTVAEFQAEAAKRKEAAREKPAAKRE